MTKIKKLKASLEKSKAKGDDIIENKGSREQCQKQNRGYYIKGHGGFLDADQISR